MNEHEISKAFRFEAAHRLRHLSSDHKCRNVHGHSYVVRVVCRGEPDDRRSFVMDYGDIAEAVDPIIERMDHSVLADEEDEELIFHMNSLGADVTRLPGQTSAEVLAKALYDWISERIDCLHCIEVDETCTSSVRYPA